MGTSIPLKHGLRLFNISKEENKARPKGRFTFQKGKRVPQGRVSSRMSAGHQHNLQIPRGVM